mmetsp:Transcript_41979/g.64279  ORF Transcript_41979/g.64279 Transcript_41979/m.64279 type:complete len:89 (-) Transcript_41979:2661-2927(-)
MLWDLPDTNQGNELNSNFGDDLMNPPSPKAKPEAVPLPVELPSPKNAQELPQIDSSATKKKPKVREEDPNEKLIHEFMIERPEDNVLT